ncbi:ATPase domain-containing protein [Paraburkholderia sp. SARCC-3016]|uniref:ATPase domain-containing protein n=1 Tax=Paraburkholderia sp. SARCC-3016 TaxID=3058611 RepID=UPI002807EB10|nr:ATPase domain-containing protein [Paraburkholderia sp. SARCC-3016]MDQ7980674.1 ATPase domain-containing protein [Paraburkholderia sp. SARCC-3016]
MDKTLARLSSDVPGLDEITGGGLIAGSSYIVQGRPGAGKTILANQIAFAQARQGCKVLYVTLLAESHDRLFQSLSTLDFYDATRVGKDLTYISLFRTLREEGLAALVSTLRGELARQNASILILDGLLNARESGQSNLDVKTFVAELQGHAAFTGCTVLFLTSARIDESSPEHTMVDGVLQLEENLVASRTVRHIRVAKSRGSRSLGGLHLFEISNRGIDVYPRLEAALANPSSADRANAARIGTGMHGLDERLGGGIPASSVSVVVGPAGSGKTTFGLGFLRLATPKRPAVHFGFYETPERLCAKALALGIDLQALVESKALAMLWRPLTENLLDKLAYDLLKAVRETKAERLFIDGLTGFERATVEPHRIVEFFAALTNELRSMGVTTVCTWEVKELSGPWVTNPSPEILSLLDNIVGMQHVVVDGVLQRSVTVMKVRDSQFESSVAQVEFADTGVGLRVTGILPVSGTGALPGRMPADQ